VDTPHSRSHQWQTFDSPRFLCGDESGEATWFGGGAKQASLLLKSAPLWQKRHAAISLADGCEHKLLLAGPAFLAASWR